MQHSFDINIAQQYGIAEAIILNHFVFWISKNKANNQNFHDGRYWTYNSIKAFSKLFPYLTENQLRRALEKLKAKGLIVTGNYNDSPYDRKLWYALTDKAMEMLMVDLNPTNEFGENAEMICEKNKSHLAKNTNEFGENAEPIADINTDINTDSKPDRENTRAAVPPPRRYQQQFLTQMQADMQEQAFERFWDSYPRKVSKPTARIAWRALPVKIQLYDKIMNALERYKRTQQWRDANYIPFPETFLQDERWEDNIIEPVELGKPKVSGDIWGNAYKELSKEWQNKSQAST